MKQHTGMESHDGYLPHSHEVRADHLGVEFVASKRWEAQEKQRLIVELGEDRALEWISVLSDLSQDGKTVSIWDAMRFALDVRKMEG